MATQPSEPPSLQTELLLERSRVTELMRQLETLQQRSSEELAFMKSKLDEEIQISKALKRANSMKAEVSFNGKGHEVKQLERKTLDSDSDSFVKEGRITSLLLENSALKDLLVTYTQTQETMEKEKLAAQVEELCAKLEAVFSDDKLLKARLKKMKVELKDCYASSNALTDEVSSLTRERDFLRQEYDELRQEKEQILDAQGGVVKAERSRLEGKLENFAEQNRRLKQDLDDAYAKLKQESKRTADVREALASRDEDIQGLKEQLQTVKSQLKTKDHSIEQLEIEINRSAQDDYQNSEALKLAKKENLQLKADVKALKTSLKDSEHNIDEIRNELARAAKEQRLLQKELGRKQEELDSLLEELDISRENVKDLKDEINNLKDEFKRQFADRVKIFQAEKLELENRLNESDIYPSGDKSLLMPSLQDELGQLDDYRPSKASMMISSFTETKRVESLKAEIADKNVLIETLTNSKADLQASLNKANKQFLKVSQQLSTLEHEKDTEIERYRLLVKDLQVRKKNLEPDDQQAKINELQAEVDLLTKQMLISHQNWADENYELSMSLRDLEREYAILCQRSQ